MLLSIVIPVYNVEQYVEKCIRSCFNHSIPYNNFEVIVVNDGSPDNSLSICETLKKEFNNIQIITQKNKGLSGARNTGLQNAKGDYVWFVDSDDWIEDNAIELIVDKLKLFSADIYWLGHHVIKNDEIIDSFLPKVLEAPISGSDFYTSCLNELFYIWKFIYKRSFLIKNDLSFYEGILYEDLEFTPRALYKAQSCMTISSALYYYLMRDGSIINNFKDKNVEHRFFIFKRLCTFIAENEVPTSFYETCYRDIVGSAISTLRTAARSGLSISDEIIVTLRQLEATSFLKPQQKRTLLFTQRFPRLYMFTLRQMYGLKRLVRK